LRERSFENFSNFKKFKFVQELEAGKAGTPESWISWELDRSWKIFDRELELWYNKMGKYFL
jgi:hypothetical protein